MTVNELLTRFPEIPAELASEPMLARYAETFAPLLRSAKAPSACAQAHGPENHHYLKLIGPLAYYGLGLATRQRALDDMRELLERHASNPRDFAESLVPADAAEGEVPGPGCA